MTILAYHRRSTEDSELKTFLPMMKRLLYSLRILAFLILLIPQYGVTQTFNSVLSSGQFFKIAVSEPGIYKLDAAFLSNMAGINLSQIPANKITLWSNGGGLLPALNSAPRVDDLRQVTLYGVGTSDGKVDAGDYFLFFAEGPDAWAYRPADGKFRKTKNIYDTRNYFFIGVTDQSAVSLPSMASAAQSELSITQFDDFQSLEQDKVNLLGKFQAPGSGQKWFGDEFSTTRQRDYEFTFDNIVSGSQVLVTAEFAGRAGETTVVTADCNGTKFNSVIGGVTIGNVETDYAKIVQVNGSYLATTDRQQIRISYPAIGSISSGWLDFIELQARRELAYSGTPMQFRALASRDASACEYVVENMSSKEAIWDISDPMRPINMEFQMSGSTARFKVTGDGTLHEYLVFTPGNGYSVPAAVGSVANQNVHGIQRADLVIIYHPDFTEAATRLASHRLTHNGYVVEMIPIDEIMNEYAGGGQDAVAIRDFARMLKQRDPQFRFLLLFGDGSYDMRHLNTDQTNENFIPVYETPESLRPIYAFPTDDYFALLSDDEGDDLKGAIDIGVGRIPVSTPEEADVAVNKILHYELSAASFGDWRLGITYVADDEDSNQHLKSSETVSNAQQNAHSQYNVRKLYLDAFQQVSTPGGERYPDVNTAINSAVEQGSLVLNYFGHGGPAGWTQERVLGTQEIQSWNNIDRLPLFVTATCSFTPYDEPSLQSAGEMVYLNPLGGAVALLTTVRAVYARSNERLTSEVFNRLLLKEGTNQMSLGEIMILAKNSNHEDTVDVNARKFALIGDPSMRITIPENDIVVTEINGNPVGTGVLDTARALELVTVKGEVRDYQGNKLSLFNGVLTATVFDKPVKLKTLANDPASNITEFETQTKVLFKGTATITNGAFTITFVIPQDISFNYGRGKISLYATDGVTDASGFSRELVIGGSASGLSDTEGPVIEIFADNANFKSGDDTSPNPVMLINLSDESGINVTGNSIGHDLEGMVDEGTNATYVLNDRYSAQIDDHTRGQATLPLSNLKPGQHTFTVVAWDIANNYSEETIEFNVVENLKDLIINLRNGPNPFDVETFFSFEHRLGDVPMKIEIEIFTTNGRLIQKFQADNVVRSSGSVGEIEWTGDDLSGRRVLPGVYFYRAVVTTQPGTSAQEVHESKFQKLILLDH